MKVAAFESTEVRMAKAGSYRGRYYWFGSAGWVAWFVAPLAPGWLISRAFTTYQRHGATSRLAVILAALLATEAIMAALLAFAHRVYMQGTEAAKGLLRANVVHAQLASGGPAAGPRSIPLGDALVRLRDDPFDALFVLDHWVDLLGSVIYAAGAVFLLARIDRWAAVAGLLPLVAIGVGNARMAHRARRYRQMARVATSDVNDFLSAAFAASLTVKVAGAQGDVLKHLGRLNERRAWTMVRDQVWNDASFGLNATLADVCVGTALVVAANRRLDAGQVALFANYLVNLVWLPHRIGSLFAGRRRAQVSATRLDDLVAPPEAGTDRLIEHRALPVLGGSPVATAAPALRRPLETLELAGLTVTGRGLNGVNLTIRRGSLVVVAGPVGSGKSSLLRAVVGLLGIDDGEVRWNGQRIEDRAAFFVPPQCAYVAQVPRLFAASLAENLRLGADLSEDDLARALELAVFDRDVAEFPHGLGTLVGTGGVRLSGGQAQRAAAARALARRPELLVLDDLTSALDTPTENALWDRLAAAQVTVLAASNRPAALARADHVVHLTAVPRPQAGGVAR